jgi:uncharacterized protein YjbI with pentapeptide repeats
VEPDYAADQTFDGINYSKEKLNGCEYEYCTFQNCEFTKAKFFNSHFLETEFIDCNFSNANLSQSLFQEVTFENCKMIGLKFNECNSLNFAAIFNNCLLNYCSFYQMDLSRTQFIKCQLKESDFVEANLETIKMYECDLLNARFENTNLKKADLTNSFNYSINPEINRIKGAIFSFPEVIGLLDTFDIRIDSNE